MRRGAVSRNDVFLLVLRVFSLVFYSFLLFARCSKSRSPLGLELVLGRTILLIWWSYPRTDKDLFI